MQRSILIDASHWGAEQPTGVELYVDSLLPLLITKLLSVGFDRVHLISPQEQPPYELPDRVTWQYVPYRPFWGQEAVMEWQLKLKPSLYFTPSGIPPVKSVVPTAFTIHDLSVYQAPRAYSLGQHFRMRYMQKRAAKKASLICVPSNYVAKDIHTRWHLPMERIVVTPLAIPEYQDGHAPHRPEWLPEAPFVMYIGRIELKKNLIPLIEGFSQLTDTEEHLVLAGGNGVGAEVVKHFITQLPEAIKSKIHLPGYIPVEEKQWLYAYADLAVVPSPYEGFGLPILEAFAAHVPVICANAGALPEIATSAALAINSNKAENWSKALYTGLRDRSLRKQLRLAGTERAAQFSWEKTAQATVDAFLTTLTSL